MKTRDVKKVPGVKKGDKPPFKGAGGENGVETVGTRVHSLENKQGDGRDEVSRLPSSDAGIANGVDLTMDDHFDVAATEGTVEKAEAVKVDPGSSKDIETVNDFKAKIEVDTEHEEGSAPDRLETDNVLEGEAKEEDEGERDEEEDEVEDEVEDDEIDDENKEQNDRHEAVNQIKKVNKVGATGVEHYKDHTLSAVRHSKEITERWKQKQLEVVVEGLSKEATEADLRKVFEKFGEVTDTRLIRNPESKNFKGYGFVRYADPLEVKLAVEKLNGAEILGQPCLVSPSEEDSILYLGNIAPNWTTKKVLETLGKYGVENVDSVVLLGNVDNEEFHQGFGFVEFASHYDAFKAFKRLQKPNAIFGGERSAKVAWAQVLDDPDEAVMLQVTSVYVDGVPSVWNGKKMMDLCGKHGEIEEIHLARKKSNPRKITFGFVKFVTREAALACIDAVNNLEVIEGDMKVKLSSRLAVPKAKRKGMKRGICGGFPIPQDTSGQVAGMIAVSSDSKGLVRKRVEKSGANLRILKKAKAENLAAHDGDRKSTNIPLERRSSQGGESTFSAHQVSKQSGPKRDLPPQGSSRKLIPRRTEDNVYARNIERGIGDDYHSDLGFGAARGRRRPYSDLKEDLRYGGVLRGNSHATLAESEILSNPYPGTQFARIPFYESSQRVPVGQAQQYAVVQGLASPPNTIIQQAPTYSIYGSSTGPVYASGAYSYTEVGRGSPYISSPFGGHSYSSQGNLYFSLTPPNISPYY